MMASSTVFNALSRYFPGRLHIAGDHHLYLFGNDQHGVQRIVGKIAGELLVQRSFKLGEGHPRDGEHADGRYVDLSFDVDNDIEVAGHRAHEVNPKTIAGAQMIIRGKNRAHQALLTHFPLFEEIIAVEGKFFRWDNLGTHRSR